MVSIEQLEKDIASERNKISGLRKQDSLIRKKKELKKELFLLQNPKLARIGREFKRGIKKGATFLLKKRQELRDKEFGVKVKKTKLRPAVLKQLKKLQSKGKKGKAFRTAQAIFEKSKKTKLRPKTRQQDDGGFFSGLTF